MSDDFCVNECNGVFSPKAGWKISKKSECVKKVKKIFPELNNKECIHGVI
jgi:hypothetical protein